MASIAPAPKAGASVRLKGLVICAEGSNPYAKSGNRQDALCAEFGSTCA